MSKNQKLQKIVEIKAWLLRKGYTPSPRNPSVYQRTRDYGVARIKIMANNLRKEVRVDHPATQYMPKSVSWVCSWSYPIYRITFTSDDKIILIPKK